MRKIIFVPAFILLLAFFSIPVFAESSTENARSEKISQYCPTIRQSLTSVQRSDAGTRTYLGKAYETFISDYITPLNLRLIKNNQPSATLSSLQTDFVSARSVFNSNYISYSKSLEELLDIDCKSSPDTFYAKLVSTREKRAEVAASTKKLSEIISSHRSSVIKLKNSLEKKDE